MWTLWQDLRYSARLLVKHPGFTLTAIGVLTLGIGANAGIFGITNGLMIRPLTGSEAPGEVVGLFSKDRTTERGYRAFSYPGFIEVREAGGPFAHLAAHNVALGGVTENNATRQALVDIVTTGFFETLGVQPVYGRDFTIEEERPGTASRPVIISYQLWERSGFDRDILKQTVRINGQDFAIVGVAPEHFTGTTALMSTEYFVPVGVHDAIESDFDNDARFPISDRRSKPLIVVGRLKPGITRDQADAQLKVIAAAHEQAYPDDNQNQDLVVRKLGRLGISTSPQDDTQLWVPLTMLQGLAAAVLLTSCLNLANMMLAFGSARQKEIAIRLAVGGARSRIVRQLLVQGLLLSFAGEVSGRIAGRITVRGALVTAQLALSLALLVLSGLFVRGAAAGTSANPGFDLAPLVLAQIEPKLGGYNAIQGREAHRTLLERLRSTPGIAAVAEASVLPFGDYSFGAAVQRDGAATYGVKPTSLGGWAAS